VGWAIVVSCTKKQFQIANLLKVESKPKFLENKYFTSCNVSKCPYPKILNEKQIFLLFLMCFGIFVSFQKKFEF